MSWTGGSKGRLISHAGTMRRRVFLGGAVAFAVGPGRVQTAQGQTVLKLVFPFAAGGAADSIIRDVAAHVSRTLGRPTIVENRAGAGGKIGALAVRDAAPDGDTLLVAAGAQMFLAPHAFGNLGYDPQADFIPVVQIMGFSQAAAVSGKVPARNLSELAAWLSADPVRAVFGSPGAGTGAHFAGLEFSRLTGVVLRHVAYRGTPAALPDLIEGRLPLFFASAAELREQHDAGAVRLIGVLEPERSPLMADIATFREQQLNLVAPAWFAVHAPARTPMAAVSMLEQAFMMAIADPAIAQRMRKLGFVPLGRDGATSGASRKPSSIAGHRS